MKSLLKLSGFVLLLVFVVLGISSCEKRATEIDSLNLSNSEIKVMAKSAGLLHNTLIDNVAKQNDLSVISNEQYRKAIYSMKVPTHTLNYFDSKIKFNKKGLYDYNSYVDEHFSNLSRLEKDYLKLINATIKGNFTSLIDSKLNIILEDILNNSKLTNNAKILLSGTLEVGRNSSIYWTDAVSNTKNPYHNFFIKKNYLSRLPVFDCVTVVDLNMFAISYNQYSQQGYDPAEASASAIQDASYQSGLAGMAGGACNVN